MRCLRLGKWGSAASRSMAAIARIAVDIRPTRTLSKPEGICSSGVGQHQVNARYVNLPYNALWVDVGVGFRADRRQLFHDHLAN